MERKPKRQQIAPDHHGTTQVRLTVLILTGLITGAATWTYLTVIDDRGYNTFEWLTIPFFVLLFAWITFSFILATIGFLSLSRPRREQEQAKTIREADGGELGRGDKTAVLMPVYNESPERVFAGITAMVHSLTDIGAADRFEFYVLSDTTNPEVWLREEIVWSEISEKLADQCTIFYRHRPRNAARKAGNIADFCTRWGRQYRFMIVLDADSLIEPETMVEMVSRMEADERIGILQVPPTPVGRMSMFARVQQFAAQAYGPIFVEGFTRWAGDDGNYWGHNAIIRVHAFLRHCDLPLLPGKAPLGGEILSHDFVEAALMLRAGWKVKVATDLAGSYEECPTTLADYAQRDQRWCQGNLQHAKLLTAENFRPLSRFHFASGVMSYVASPLWIAFTVLCIIGMVVDRQSVRLANSESAFADRGALILFCVSMTMLLLPKFWSVLWLLASPDRARLFAGRAKLVFSSLVEVACSVLLSPIMAIYHSRFVTAALCGTNVSWSSQQRDEYNVSWREAVSQFTSFTVVGLALWGLIGWFMPELLIWFSPIIAGLVLSIPIGKFAGSAVMGAWLLRLGILVIPQETRLPRVLRYHQQALDKMSGVTNEVDEDLFSRFLDDAELQAIHQQIQAACDANVEMDPLNIDSIKTAFATGGAKAIEAKWKHPILLDAEVCRDLHVEAQLAPMRRP